MRNLRDLIKQSTESLRAAQPGPPVRPNSLYAAGAVGNPVRVRPRPRTPKNDSETEGDRFVHRDIYPEKKFETDITERRERSRASVAPPRGTGADRAAAVRQALRSAASLRTAMLVREVLDPPISLREDRW